MYITNIHERKISAASKEVGALLDTVSSTEDRMWPYENWSNIKFDRPLEVGAIGGHGPIRYTVTSYTPGKSIRFIFTKDFDGYHELVLIELDATRCLLRHPIQANTTGFMFLMWFMMIRPLHNALVEDLFDKVEIQVSCNPRPRSWGLWVKLLRRLRRLPTHNKHLNSELGKKAPRPVK